MLDTERERFMEGYQVLADCYPGYRPSVEEMAKQAKAYFDRLETYSWQDVSKALMRASQPEFYPDRFPTVGQLQAVVEDCRRRRAKAEREETQQRMDEREAESARGRMREIPVTQQAQRTYIQEGGTGWEKLARYWECESKARKLDPTKPTPPEIYQRRMGEFWKMWGEA